MTPSTRTFSERTASMSVIEQVASRDGVDPLELEPLYYTIDPDALDGLFSPSQARECSIEFTYHGYHVTVTRTEETQVDVSLTAAPASGAASAETAEFAGE